jgi:NAD(P)-dependent dehydrogenase (short-subunit alcohol dehydrogenase family)
MSGTAIVTGAARGIGRAIALELARAGYGIAAVDLEAPQAVASELASIGANSMALACDISDLKLHEKMLDAAAGTLGPLKVLVNNAGVSVKSRGDLLDVSAESYDLCQAVNTRGTFFLTQAFARHLLKSKVDQHRSIIIISSTNAIAPSILRGEYCVSKAGASMVTKLFAARLSNDGIGVYEIQPGIIETEMTAPSKARYAALIDGGATVIKRFGRPEDVARIAATLAQGLLPYTSGQVIYADGGLLSVRY